MFIRSRVVFAQIACHIQEIPENGADVAHLSYIHGAFLLSWLGRLVRHEWSAVWDTQSDRQVSHIAKLVLNQRVAVLGHTVPGTSLDSRIDQVGPALVQLIFPTPFGKVSPRLAQLAFFACSRILASVHVSLFCSFVLPCHAACSQVAVIETVTPILHTLQRAQNVLWAEKTVPRWMAKVRAAHARTLTLTHARTHPRSSTHRARPLL